MSEGQAFRRTNAARLVRKFPSLLARIERGEIHLSSLVLLRDHFTMANVDELALAASGKSKREVQELLARRAPRPDVPGTVRKLPKSTLTLPSVAVTARPTPIEPLSEARYKVQLTASAELRDKLERARALMRHRNPSGDLAVVVECALDVLLQKLEKETRGRTTRPRRQADTRRTTAGRVTRAVRREVFERDEEQCAFVDDKGRRCPAGGFLELDHVESRALGGSDESKNLRVLCRPHNLLHAEQVSGRRYVEGRIDLRRRKRKSPRAAGPLLDEEPQPPQVAPRGDPGELLDVATCGLVSMGFRRADARQALDVVAARHAGDESRAQSIQEILRGALAVLT